MEPLELVSQTSSRLHAVVQESLGRFSARNDAFSRINLAARGKIRSERKRIPRKKEVTSGRRRRRRRRRWFTTLATNFNDRANQWVISLNVQFKPLIDLTFFAAGFNVHTKLRNVFLHGCSRNELRGRVWVFGLQGPPRRRPPGMFQSPCVNMSASSFFSVLMSLFICLGLGD